MLARQLNVATILGLGALVQAAPSRARIAMRGSMISTGKVGNSAQEQMAMCAAQQVLKVFITTTAGHSCITVNSQ